MARFVKQAKGARCNCETDPMTWSHDFITQVLIDGKAPHAVALMLTSSRFMLAPSWIEQAKAVKNDVEIQGFRNAYARDGAAMVRLDISSSTAVGN